MTKNLKKRIKDWLYNKLYSKDSYLKASQRAYEHGFELGLESSKILYEKRVALLTEENEKALKEKELWLNSLWFVDPTYVFGTTKTGLIQLNGQQVTTTELKNLKAEVRALKNFEIYKILQSTIRQKAIDHGFSGATDLYSQKGNEQVLAGKMMVYNLDIIKTIINAIEKAR